MIRGILVFSVALGFGCGGEETVGSGASTVIPPTSETSRGITVGGPQDIALFRQIVERGEVPSPDTLDPIGFFAEHAVDLPPANCGTELCVYPMFTVMPTFAGGNWTMAYVALHTPVDPRELERPPMHMIVVVENAADVPWLREGLELAARTLAVALRSTDRISIVAFGETPQVLVTAAGPRDRALALALDQFGNLPQTESADLYSALAEGDRLAQDVPGFENASRLILVTTGRANSGISNHDRIISRGVAIAQSGTSISVVGMGDAYEPPIAEALGFLGAGSYSYAQDGADLENIFGQEGSTALFPLAADLSVTVEAAPGYRLGRTFGTRGVIVQGHVAGFESPQVFLAQREGSSDPGNGRRGGGSGLFVELIATGEETNRERPAFTVSATWQHPQTRANASTTASIVNPLSPGQNPDGMWPHFSDPDRGKVFMMLNMYLALRAIVRFFDAGDCARALGVTNMMQLSIDGFQSRYTDPDIAADHLLMQALDENVLDGCIDMSPVPPEPILPIDSTGSESGCGFL